MKKIQIQVILGIVAILFVAFIVGSAVRSGGILFRDHAAVVQEMKALNRWETAQFTIEQIIDGGTTGNVFQEFLFGDSILLIAHGTVIAGVDMSKLSASDVNVSRNEVTIHLPAPELFITALDNTQTRVYDRKTGILTKGKKDLESQARQTAESKITAAACASGILTQAKDNAIKQVTSMLSSFQFNKVTVLMPDGECR